MYIIILCQNMHYSRGLLHGVSSQREGSNVNETKEGANSQIEESVAKANWTL